MAQKTVRKMIVASALVLMGCYGAAVAQSEPATRIALMPFFLGQLESPNATLPRPLSQPLPLATVDDRRLPEGSDQIMNRLVDNALRQRFQNRLIPWEQVAAAFESVSRDPELDTPRKQAVRLGQAVEADWVMVGTVWRFREKGMVEGVPDSPASVGLALYLVDVATGERLWRGSFDGTQKALTQDVLGGIKQLDMGLRWLTAEALARYGVKSVLNTLPPAFHSRPKAEDPS